MKKFETICRIISIIFMFVMGVLFIAETHNTIEFPEYSNLFTTINLILGVSFMYMGIFGVKYEIETRQN